MGSWEPSIITRLGCERDRGKEVLGRWLQSQLALGEIVGWESGSSSHMGVVCIILGYDCHCSNVIRLLLTNSAAALNPNPRTLNPIKRKGLVDVHS